MIDGAAGPDSQRGTFDGRPVYVGGQIMQEKWVKWNAGLDEVPKKLYLESLTDNKDGLTLVFSNENSTRFFRFIYEDSVLSYRNTDESYMLRTINHIRETYGREMFEHPLFIVENSSYIEWFNLQSYDIYKNYDPKHYIFLTPNDIVEVISNYPPKIMVD